MAQPSPTARNELPTGTVTFLFTDIEGSTRLSQQLGDDFAAVIDRHHAIMRNAFVFCGGIVVSTEGDAFFAVFGDAGDAVVGTITAQRELAAEAWPEGVDVRVRMGLHTGAARLGGDNYAGVDVNRAARVAAAGHGGQVLLSSVTAGLIRGSLPEGVEMRDLGEVLLKDIDVPEAVFQLDIEGLPSEFPPLRAQRPGWLPDPLTTFLGRGPEMTDVDKHLRTNRLVTLTGPGGTGKTRLSIEVARKALPRFPGGAWFVPLETIRDPALVLPEVADRMEVMPDGQRAIRESLAEHVGDKPTLLVLDNLEQVVDVGSELGQLLGDASGLHILASSREALRIAAEQEFPVPVMDEDMALLLFVERARRVKPGFALRDDESADVRAIVSQLDCLPLAIELAAARTRMFPPRKLRERLEARTETLSGGSRDLPDRQRTLRGAVEWSYELLDEDEQSTFRRFSVFAGGADFEAATAIIDPDATLGMDVLDILASLADKSLLQIEDFDGEPRVRMLQTIRDFATERLADDPEAAAVAERHARHYQAFAKLMEPELSGEHPGEAFVQMEDEHDNLRAALAWSVDHDLAVGLEIGGAIWRFWQQRAHLVEGRQRLEQLLAQPGSADDPCAQAAGATGLGGMDYWQGDIAAARELYTTALAAQRACGEEAAIALGLYNLAFPTAFGGEIDAATAMLDESLAIYTALGDENGIALAKEAQVVVAMSTQDYQLARSIQEGVVDIRRRQGGLFKRGDSIGLLAIIEARLGDSDAARKHADEAYEIYLELGGETFQAGGLQTESLVALQEGRPEIAAFLAGTLQGMRDTGAKILIPSDTLGFPDPADDARELLGDAFEEHFEAGRRYTPDEAFERVRDWPPSD